ncbi:MAG: TIM-barrel domain-containing protein, partial [Balneolaceae bacterium]
MFLSSCIPLPEADYYSVGGVISIEAESHKEYNNWYTSHYYTSIGMTSADTSVSAATTLDYRFYVTEPGEYAIWLLSRKYSTEPDENFLELALFDDDNVEISRSKVQLPSSNALVWVHDSFDDNRPATVNFPNRGFYEIRIESFGKPGYRLVKIHLTFDNEIQPEGLGLPETSDPYADPVEMKRNRVIHLPPAWAFGVIYGGYTNQEETIERVNRLYQNGYPADAYWIDSLFLSYQNNGTAANENNHLKEDTFAFPGLNKMWDYLEERNIKSGIRVSNSVVRVGNEDDVADFKSGIKPFFEKGLDFLNPDPFSDISFTQAAFEATQEFTGIQNRRGFALSHIHNIYDKRFLQYPVNWSGYSKIAWTQPDYPDFSSFAMGGFKENIEMAANPRLTTYEVPFLSHDMGGYNVFDGPGISDELYIRWTQFAAFNTLMHVFSSADNPTANMPWNFSETAQQNFKAYTILRNRLFPYIYTHA